MPYCTGDVHVGAGELPVWNVAFNGRANAAAALEYAYERVAEPETVLVTGCSAGSLGAVVWSRWVAAHYVNARHIQFGDSYIGVTSPVRFALDLPGGALPPLPPLPPPASCVRPNPAARCRLTGQRWTRTGICCRPSTRRRDWIARRSLPSGTISARAHRLLC